MLHLMFNVTFVFLSYGDFISLHFTLAVILKQVAVISDPFTSDGQNSCRPFILFREKYFSLTNMR